ncbi:MAG: terminase family protein, partial [Hyphomonas sp.]|nr:terminase family protein [Hyphomonas sp.]
MLQAGYRRVALVAPNFSDVREVMIEGPSGLIWTSAKADRPAWQPSRHRLEWDSGAVAYGFSAEDPDSLRGPQFDLAWCDEAGAWPRGEAVWDNLQLALRLGPHPLAMVTTTPRATALIRRLKADPMVVETITRMADNAANLAPGFVDVMQAAYGGTQLGRQELDGVMIDDPAGAMFDRARIDALRVTEAPLVFDDCIVAVDPNISAKPGADACGIILAGIRDGVGYVLGDASAPGLKPLDWALRAVRLAEIGGASMILAEANQGGDM